MGTLESCSHPHGHHHVAARLGRLRPRVHAAPHRDLPRLHGPLRRGRARGLGVLPAAVILLAFIPFVWGIGIASAGAILTFKRGAGCNEPRGAPARVHLGRILPSHTAPRVDADVAEYNPLAIAIEGPSARRCWGNRLGRGWPTTCSYCPALVVWRSSPARSLQAGFAPRTAPRNAGALLSARGQDPIFSRVDTWWRAPHPGRPAPPPCRAPRGPPLARAGRDCPRTWSHRAQGRRHRDGRTRLLERIRTARRDR